MKIMILNGSPRLQGNTRTALIAVVDGIAENISDAQIEFVDITKLDLSGCIACDQCKSNGGSCVILDDSAELIEKLALADVIIFGTPVYWWGVSAQLKVVIDKMYSKSEYFQHCSKKLGIIAVGANPENDIQYELISTQFKCISNYLGWDLVIDKSLSAYAPGEIAKNEAEIKDLSKLWKNLK